MYSDGWDFVVQVLTCVSVNMGVMPLSILEVVPHSEGIFTRKPCQSNPLTIILFLTGAIGLNHGTDKNASYAYGRYFNPKFPDMNTMYCFSDVHTGHDLSMT